MNSHAKSATIAVSSEQITPKPLCSRAAFGNRKPAPQMNALSIEHDSTYSIVGIRSPHVNHTSQSVRWLAC